MSSKPYSSKNHAQLGIQGHVCSSWEIITVNFAVIAFSYIQSQELLEWTLLDVLKVKEDLVLVINSLNKDIKIVEFKKKKLKTRKDYPMFNSCYHTAPTLNVQ